MGKSSSVSDAFSPTLLYLSRNEEKVQDFDGRDNVRPVKFETAREARDFIKQYEGVEDLKFMDMNDLYINTSVKSFLMK